MEISKLEKFQSTTVFLQLRTCIPLLLLNNNFALKTYGHRISFWEISFVDEKCFRALSIRKLKSRFYKIAPCACVKAMGWSAKPAIPREEMRIPANGAFFFPLVVSIIRDKRNEYHKYPKVRLFQFFPLFLDR